MIGKASTRWPDLAKSQEKAVQIDKLQSGFKYQLRDFAL